MRSIHRTVIAVALAAFTGAGIGAVQDVPAPPTGVISGVVTDAATGRPIEGVLIDVSPSRKWTMTDAEGRFVVEERPAGRYTITAKKDGVFDGRFKIGTPGLGDTTLIVLADAEKYTKADITLLGVASIEGRVADERGDPMPDVVVRLLISQPVSGQDRWFAGPATRTRAQGDFSITNLRPGTYRVVVVSTQHTRPGVDSPAFVYP